MVNWVFFVFEYAQKSLLLLNFFRLLLLWLNIVRTDGFMKHCTSIKFSLILQFSNECHCLLLCFSFMFSMELFLFLCFFFVLFLFQYQSDCFFFISLFFVNFLNGFIKYSLILLLHHKSYSNISSYSRSAMIVQSY